MAWEGFERNLYNATHFTKGVRERNWLNFNMLLKQIASIASLVAFASAKIFYAGVAQSSGEFGVWSQDKKKGTGLPGKFGTDYAFIDKKGIDTYVDQNKVGFLL